MLTSTEPGPAMDSMSFLIVLASSVPSTSANGSGAGAGGLGAVALVKRIAATATSSINIKNLPSLRKIYRSPHREGAGSPNPLQLHFRFTLNRSETARSSLTHRY